MGDDHGDGGEVRITQLAGEVFRADQEPSSIHVLWGELIKGNERTFLRETMKEEQVSELRPH